MYKHPYLLLVLLWTGFFMGCHSGIKEKKSWQSYLDSAQAEGCLMLYDNMHDQVSVYPVEKARQRYVPGSGFVVFSSLVALESGLVADTSSIVPISDTDSMSMGDLFRQHPAALNQWLSTHIRKAVMQFWLDSVHYGNQVSIDTTQPFWQNGILRISPDEQLGLLIHLYFHELSFHERPQRLVQQIMLKENTSRYSLSYVTAAVQTDTTAQAWMLGWEEENKHPYFFTVFLESRQQTPEQLRDKAIALTRKWLSDQGFFQGRK